MALPFVNECRALYSNDKISIIGKSWVSAIYTNHPLIDQTIIFENSSLKGLGGTIRSGRSLKKYGLDKGYLLSDSLRSAFIVKISGIKERIGYRGQGRSVLLTKPVERPVLPMHRSKKFINLLRSGEIYERNSTKSELIGITLNEEEKTWAKRKLNDMGFEKPVAIFHSSVAESRRVPFNKWVEIIDHILASGKRIIFFGSSSEQALSEGLINRFNSANIVSVCGYYNLRESIALISECDGSIATDSGLGHISASLGLKTVSLFGAGDPSLTQPIGPKVKIINSKVHCSPCLKNQCYNRKEPLLCLHAIEAKTVWKSYLSL